MKDAAGRYLLINRRYEELFGINRQQIAGKTDHDVFPKDTADAFRANDLTVIRGGRPMDLEEIVPQQDGTHIYISTKFPIRDAEGNIYAVCGMSTDITDRKKMEQDLRAAREELEHRVLERTADLAKANEDLQRQIEERERMEADLRKERDFINTVLNTVSAPVVVIDATARIIRFNRACERITGYSAPEVEGRMLWFLIPPEQRADVKRVLEKLAAGTIPGAYENYWMAKDGARRLISWSNAAV